MTDQTTKPEASVPRVALRPKDTAQALGIGQRKLWELTNCGLLPHVRLGKAVLYPVDRLREWLAEQLRPANQSFRNALTLGWSSTSGLSKWGGSRPCNASWTCPIVRPSSRMADCTVSPAL